MSTAWSHFTSTSTTLYILNMWGIHFEGLNIFLLLFLNWMTPQIPAHQKSGLYFIKQKAGFIYGHAYMHSKCIWNNYIYNNSKKALLLCRMLVCVNNKWYMLYSICNNEQWWSWAVKWNRHSVGPQSEVLLPPTLVSQFFTMYGYYYQEDKDLYLKCQVIPSGESFYSRVLSKK